MRVVMVAATKQEQWLIYVYLKLKCSHTDVGGPCMYGVSGLLWSLPSANAIR